jgi:hypothetical protein
MHGSVSFAREFMDAANLQRVQEAHITAHLAVIASNRISQPEEPDQIRCTESRRTQSLRPTEQALHKASSITMTDMTSIREESEMVLNR